MLGNRAFWSSLAATGFYALLAAAPILADNSKEENHDYAWALVGYGVLAIAIGGAMFALLSGRTGGVEGIKASSSGKSSPAVAGETVKDNTIIGTQNNYFPQLAEAVSSESQPNVVFSQFAPVLEQMVTPANISENALSEFARLQFINSPKVKSERANITDLHARIELSQNGKVVLLVPDGRWSENVDKGEAPERETKSTTLPCNGETRTLDVVMQRRGQDECYGWNHQGFQIRNTAIPKGVYLVRVTLEASNMEQRTFLFELVNHGSTEHLELKELPDGEALPVTLAADAFAIQCHAESGLRLGEPLVALAYLVVRDLRSGKVSHGCARVLEVIHHTEMTINGVSRPYRERLYKHQELYLKWEASDTRYHDFHTDAKLRVAIGRSGTGYYLLTTVEPQSLFPRLHLFDSYEITLEVSADNRALLRRVLFLKMKESSFRDEDGRLVLVSGVPYPVEFREWAESDQPADEQDLDALRSS